MQLVARKNTHKNHRTSFRTEVKSVVHQDARYERISEFRTEGKSFVHQDARYNRNNAPAACNLLHEIKTLIRGNHSCNKMHATIWEKRAVAQM